MFRKTLRAHQLCVIVLLSAAAGAVGSSAQDAQRKEASGEGASNSVLTAHLVKTGLYMFSSDGGNSLLRLSANGMIVVDGQLPGSCEALQKQVRKISRISDQSIRILITTDHHLQRTGCNAKLLSKGVQILAHENAKQNLANYNPPGDTIAPPTKTYDHDFTVKLGGIEVQLLHFGNAHTNGDTVVYFPNLKVVAVGDLFATTPDPSFAEGGSLVGWGPVLAEILKLDFDVVVPGTGPSVTRADLAAFKAKIDRLVSRAAGLVKKGVSKDRLMAELKTDDLGWRFSFTGDRLDRFYDELSRAK
jgi:glyoxylase-like metal-dependent hydrolase (beta-lactamase superfamily II)